MCFRNANLHRYTKAEAAMAAAAAVQRASAEVGLNRLNPVLTHSLQAPGFNP
jgi:hypothetical protein